MVLVVTSGKGYVVLYVRTRVEEVLGLVVAIRRRLFLAPAGNTSGFVNILVLELGHDEGVCKLRAVANGNANLAFLAFLGGNHHNTLCGSRAIKGSSGRTAKHRDAFDIFGVDVGNAFRTGLRRVHAARFAMRGVGNWHTVDYIQCLVALRDTLRTTHHHARCTTHTRRRGVDVDTGHFTVERVHEVGVLHRGQFVCSHLLYVVAQCLFRTANTQGRNHNLVYLSRFRLQRNRYIAIRRHGHFLCLVAQVANNECCASMGVKRKVTVDVGNGGCLFALNAHGGADNGFVHAVEHCSRNLHLVVLLL